MPVWAQLLLALGIPLAAVAGLGAAGGPDGLAQWERDFLEDQAAERDPLARYGKSSDGL